MTLLKALQNFNQLMDNKVYIMSQSAGMTTVELQSQSFNSSCMSYRLSTKDEMIRAIVSNAARKTLISAGRSFDENTKQNLLIIGAQGMCRKTVDCCTQLTDNIVLFSSPRNHTARQFQVLKHPPMRIKTSCPDEFHYICIYIHFVVMVRF